MGGIICKKPQVPDPELYVQDSFRSSLLTWTHGDIWVDYLKRETLGSGMSGSIFRILKKQTKEGFACKGVSKNTVRVDMIQDMMKEVALLKTLDHPNVIRLHEMWITNENYFMVLELAEGNDLHTNLMEHKFFGEFSAGKIFSDALKAVRYIHTRGVAHRDIKLANFVFVPQASKADGRLRHRLKLIDFGLSTKFFTKPQKSMTELVGTLYYIAPEMVAKERYTNKCDMWALGVVLYMLLSGQPPFPGRTTEEVLGKACGGAVDFGGFQWGIISDSAKDLVQKLLTVDPAKRLSAQEASQHPWVKDIPSTHVSKEELTEAARAMSEFSDLGILRQTALDLMVLQEPQKHLEKLSATFLALDTRGNGTITREEFVDALKCLDQSPDCKTKTLDPKLLFSKIDRDNTGFICYSEFLAATVRSNIELTESRMEKVFKKLDVDGSGSITGSNLKSFAYIRQRYTEEEISAMIKEMDFTQSGSVSYGDFTRAMSSRLLPPSF